MIAALSLSSLSLSLSLSLSHILGRIEQNWIDGCCVNVIRASSKLGSGVGLTSFPPSFSDTSDEAPPSAQKPRDLEVRPGDMPKVLIIVITIVGTALLVLNVALIACFVRRRHRKRIAKGEH